MCSKKRTAHLHLEAKFPCRTGEQSGEKVHFLVLITCFDSCFMFLFDYVPSLFQVRPGLTSLKWFSERSKFCNLLKPHAVSRRARLGVSLLLEKKRPWRCLTKHGGACKGTAASPKRVQPVHRPSPQIASPKGPQ